VSVPRDVRWALVAAACLAVSSLALSSCGGQRVANADEAMIAAKPVTPELDAWIAVPSDAAAKYRALAVERRGNDVVQIDVLREGVDLKRYSTRIVDCQRHLFAFARDAGTQEMFEKQTPEVGPMEAWAPDTPGESIARYACAVAGGR
jgi:hypothetical protein